MLQSCIRLLILCACSRLAPAQDGGFPSPSQAGGYIELAFRYGPFAFAVFFALGAWWMLRSAQNAASSPAQARLCRQFAIACGAACLAFAVVGTYYWMRFGSTHFYIGQIKDLKTYEELASDNFFLRKELKAEPGETPLYYNLHFVVMQAQPFWAGQRFEVAYYKKGSQTRKIIEFGYDGIQGQSYRFEYDDQDRPVRLVRIPSTIQPAGKQAAARFSFAVFAQVIPVLLMSPRPSTAFQGGAPPVDLRLIGLLQDGRSDVGAKIDALGRLLNMDPPTLKAYANTVVGGESFALTLIELSRHSDKELAGKARKAAESSDVEGVLARQLGSSNSEARKAAEQAMTRISPDRAERILAQAKPSPGKQLVKAKPRTGVTQQILSPVGSEGGDRYYVQAQWDPRDQKVVSCLTAAFKSELISNRSLQDEQKLMAGRSTRLVYWYTKDWALMMADKIRGCGAKATFPQPKK